MEICFRAVPRPDPPEEVRSSGKPLRRANLGRSLTSPALMPPQRCLLCSESERRTRTAVGRVIRSTGSVQVFGAPVRERSFIWTGNKNPAAPASDTVTGKVFSQMSAGREARGEGGGRGGEQP